MMHPFCPQVFPDYEQLSAAAAQVIVDKMITKLSGNGTFVLGCATGATPEGLYRHLITLLRKQQLDLSRLYTFNLDEYSPIKRSDPQSYYQFMRQHLWEPVHEVNPSFDYQTQVFLPSGEATNTEAECQAYEEKIRRVGGIDIQILGIGINGHIGFNEPGSPRDSRTRMVDLTPSTREVNSRFFGSLEHVPTHALTMGIASILAAKEILVLASGNAKAPIIQALHVLEEPTEDIPASWLLTHPEVSFYIDTAAATTA